MARIVIDCANPNDFTEVVAAAEKAAGSCNITYFKQHEELKKAGKSNSIRESARIISKETEESPEAVRMKISRGKVEQHVPEKSSYNKNQVVTQNVPKLTNEGGARPNAGRPKKYYFNETNDNIEWAKWSWNPVTGCKHGCPYCYARDIANRFYVEGFEPTFRPERLRAPKDTTITEARKNEEGIRNVFVCSMADLFGDWVPKEWIQAVFLSVFEAPEWNFIFLTKNPKRYLELKFPKNCWIGATATNQKMADYAFNIFRKIDFPVIKFLSCEPLKGKIELTHPIPINWIIIGGQSRTSGEEAYQPEYNWVRNLDNQASSNGVKVYWKPNLTVRPKEYPSEGR